MKERLSGKFSLASKLRLKRAVFAPVVWALRLAARAYNFAERLAGSAEANGVDLRRAFDVKQRPGPPHAQVWGASDFLFLARAAADGPESLDPGRPVTTSVIIPVFNKVEFTFQCLRSLVREVDFKETEVIVVDNASADRTRELLAHFSGYVRVVENEE